MNFLGALASGIEDAVGRPAGLSRATAGAVRTAARDHGPTAALSTVLASPDLVIA